MCDSRPKVILDNISDEEADQWIKEMLHVSSEMQRTSNELQKIVQDSVLLFSQQAESNIRNIELTSKSFLLYLSNQLNESTTELSETAQEILSEISLPETAVSDFIDQMLPILAVLDIPEPQREIIEEYKKSYTLSKEDLQWLIGTILMILSLLQNHYYNEQRKKEDSSSQTVIVDNHSEYHITQYFDNFANSDNQQTDSTN